MALQRVHSPQDIRRFGFGEDWSSLGRLVYSRKKVQSIGKMAQSGISVIPLLASLSTVVIGPHCFCFCSVWGIECLIDVSV